MAEIAHFSDANPPKPALYLWRPKSAQSTFRARPKCARATSVIISAANVRFDYLNSPNATARRLRSSNARDVRRRNSQTGANIGRADVPSPGCGRALDDSKLAAITRRQLGQVRERRRRARARAHIIIADSALGRKR